MLLWFYCVFSDYLVNKYEQFNINNGIDFFETAPAKVSFFKNLFCHI